MFGLALVCLLDDDGGLNATRGWRIANVLESWRMLALSAENVLCSASIHLSGSFGLLLAIRALR